MAISFPSAPTVGQTYTYNSYTWQWNGYAWDNVTPDLRLQNNTWTGANYYPQGSSIAAYEILGLDSIVPSSTLIAYDTSFNNFITEQSNSGTWTTVAVPSAIGYASYWFAFGPSIIIATVTYGGSSYGYTTDGGKTWLTSTFPTSSAWIPVWAGTQFVALWSGGTDVLTSPDGLTWTTHSAVAASDAYSTSARAIIYAGGKIVAAGQHYIQTSTDGITWTNIANPSTNLSSPSIDWDGTRYLVIGSSASETSVIESTNGTTWSSVAFGGALAGVTINSPTIAASASTGVSVITGTVSSAQAYYYSTDGVTWVATSAPNAFSFRSMWSDGITIFVNMSDGSVYGTTNGSTWVSYGLPSQYAKIEGAGITDATTYPSLQTTTISAFPGTTLKIASPTITSATVTSSTISGGTASNVKLVSPTEPVYINTGGFYNGASASISPSTVTYFTGNSTSTGSLYIYGQTTPSFISFSSYLPNVGDSVTLVALVTNGATAYYINNIYIDNTSTTVKWSGGSAPTSGNANAIDAYTFTIIKTATTPAYIVLASQSKFA